MSDGYAEFKRKMKDYKNKEIIGICIGELISVKPVTIRVKYGESAEFEFVKFNSLVNMENLKSDDIGKKYAVELTTDNKRVYVLGSVESYNNYLVGE